MGRLNRYGEPLDELQTAEIEHQPDCDGWLGHDIGGALIPCLVCKPHLAKRGRRMPTPVFRHDPPEPGRDRTGKAQRLLTEGRVDLLLVTPQHVQARVRGDTGTWEVARFGRSPLSCNCPARGACSHTAAVALVLKETA